MARAATTTTNAVSWRTLSVVLALRLLSSVFSTIELLLLVLLACAFDSYVTTTITATQCDATTAQCEATTNARSKTTIMQSCVTQTQSPSTASTATAPTAPPPVQDDSHDRRSSVEDLSLRSTLTSNKHIDASDAWSRGSCDSTGDESICSNASSNAIDSAAQTKQRATSASTDSDDERSPCSYLRFISFASDEPYGDSDNTTADVETATSINDAVTDGDTTCSNDAVADVERTSSNDVGIPRAVLCMNQSAESTDNESNDPFPMQSATDLAVPTTPRASSPFTSFKNDYLPHVSLSDIGTFSSRNGVAADVDAYISNDVATHQIANRAVSRCSISLDDEPRSVALTNKSATLLVRNTNRWNVFKRWRKCSVLLSHGTGEFAVDNPHKADELLQAVPLARITGVTLHSKRHHEFKVEFDGHVPVRLRAPTAQDAESWAHALKHAKETTWRQWV